VWPRALRRHWLTALLSLLALVAGGAVALLLVPAPGVAPTPTAPRARPEPPVVPVVTDPPSPQPRPAAKVRRVVCIDPGHPSENGAGAVARDGLREVVANWQVAELLRDELVARGLRVVLTKANRGQKVANIRRAEVANEAHAALSVRLHCDANGGQGYAVYYPAEQGTAHGRTGPSKAVREASERAATAMAAALDKALVGDLASNGVRTDRETAIGRRQGALTGSIFSTTPVITVEMVDLTHAGDARWMADAANRGKMAQALADGVMRYLDGAL